VTGPTSEDGVPAGRPALRLVRGDAQPEELAALVAVLSARTGGPEGAASDRRPARGRWGDPADAVRRVLPPGPGAWQASGRPR
jgi:Acyl-CoA carboxylase epsilon subunit